MQPGPAYGPLPRNVHYPRDVRRMLQVPTGQPGVFNPNPDPQR
jgi:hypothetical protein